MKLPDAKVRPKKSAKTITEIVTEEYHKNTSVYRVQEALEREGYEVALLDIYDVFDELDLHRSLNYYG